jgi:hypothetical protein
LNLDIAKAFLHVHTAEAASQIVLRRRFRRWEVVSDFEDLPKVLVSIEAFGTGHYPAREIAALRHEVRLLPPSWVRRSVKRGKTDAANAEETCEADNALFAWTPSLSIRKVTAEGPAGPSAVGGNQAWRLRHNMPRPINAIPNRPSVAVGVLGTPPGIWQWSCGLELTSPYCSIEAQRRPRRTRPPARWRW